ncbi:MAG: 50S ribosomal protein L9 [Desulfobacterales bacterium]|nr:50S ribosomal protein L9 [Desulfobacterales bacterium]
MKVILKETIDTLGIIGSEVKVADGYGRNYLLPQGKALEATPQNRKRIAQSKLKVDLQIAKEKQQAEELAKRIDNLECSILVKATDEKKLYGSVTTHDVVEALAKQNIEVERRMILLKTPIKELGTYKVPIRIYKGVEPEINLNVISE